MMNCLKQAKQKRGGGLMNTLKNKGMDILFNVLKLENYGITEQDKEKIKESINFNKTTMSYASGVIDLKKLNENNGISNLLKNSITFYAPNLDTNHIENINKIIVNVVNNIVGMDNTAFTFSCNFGPPPRIEIDFVNVATFDGVNYSINIANILENIELENIEEKDILPLIKYCVPPEIYNHLDYSKMITELAEYKKYVVESTDPNEKIVDGEVGNISNDIEEAIREIMGNENKTTGGMKLQNMAKYMVASMPSLAQLASSAKLAATGPVSTVSEKQEADLETRPAGNKSTEPTTSYGGAGPYTFTLTAPNVPQDKINAINEEICKMISKSLNSELETFKKDLGNIATTVLKDAKENLLGIMEDHFINGLEQKLIKMENEIVDTVESEDLIQNIVFGMGLKFNEALEHKQDVGNYAAYNDMLNAEKNNAQNTNDQPPPDPQAEGQGEGEGKVPHGELEKRVAERKMTLERKRNDEKEVQNDVEEVQDLPPTPPPQGNADSNKKGGRKTKRKNKTKRKKQNKTKRKRT